MVQKVRDDRLRHRLSTSVYIGNKAAVNAGQVGILEAEKALWKLHLPRPFNP
jgi:hypothetical protein